VYLVGLSAGGNGVWNLAYRNPERFAGLVAVCGWVMPPADRPETILPPDSGPPCPVIAGRIRSLPIWIWHGDADSVVAVEESRRMAEALRADGAKVTCTELLGGLGIASLRPSGHHSPSNHNDFIHPRPLGLLPR
jgi:predicted peptidase